MNFTTAAQNTLRRVLCCRYSQYPRPLPPPRLFQNYFRSFSATSNPSSHEHEYSNILVSFREKVALITLNRPKALNALNIATCHELATAIQRLDQDATINAMVITGSDRAFAAGADIKEMVNQSPQEARFKHALGDWIHSVYNCQKPMVAAVNGFALGGGCELAMACDIIIAGENAFFGQPEIQIGTIPGWGGTQSLIRAVGKAKAMEMILTGRRMSAQEAESSGLVARVVRDENVVDEAIQVAQTIASYSAPIVQIAKECVKAAFDTNLQQGLRFERRQFHSTFALRDQKEGMTAFIEKRDPDWSHK